MTADEVREAAEAETPVYWDCRVWRIGEIDFAAETVLLVRPIFEFGRRVPFAQLALTRV
jgi:hypothetical protein